MDNTGDRKSIRAKEKAARIAAANRAAVIRTTMSTIEGRHWLWDILAACHCFATTFNGDALQSAFNEGRRSVGLALLADIMLTCPDSYIQAMRESNVRDTTDERRSGPIDDRRDSGPSDPGDGDSEGGGLEHDDGDPVDLTGQHYHH